MAIVSTREKQIADAEEMWQSIQKLLHDGNTSGIDVGCQREQVEIRRTSANDLTAKFTEFVPGDIHVSFRIRRVIDASV